MLSDQLEMDICEVQYHLPPICAPSFERIKKALRESCQLPTPGAPTPEGEICPHARLKWAVYDCAIKDSIALDLMDCNGKGTYSVPGGGTGFGYSHQCNRVPGKLLLT